MAVWITEFQLSLIIVGGKTALDETVLVFEGESLHFVLKFLFDNVLDTHTHPTCPIHT